MTLKTEVKLKDRRVMRIILDEFQRYHSLEKSLGSIILESVGKIS
jgi:hypothetical protein